jgi:hypothetical protein
VPADDHLALGAEFGQRTGLGERSGFDLFGYRPPQQIAADHPIDRIERLLGVRL